MSLELFGYKSVQEKISREKQWMENDFADCPVKYDPEAVWRDNAVICRLSLLKPYCEQFGIYQILNKEFNDALASDVEDLELSPVLEVGAGNGDLANVLRSRGVALEAVDNNAEPLGLMCERLDYREALAKYRPQLVICSWMPQGCDWTSDFRDTDSVSAYILIGEEDKTIWRDYPGWRSRVLKGPNKWSLCRLDNGVDFDRPELWWRHSKVVLFERV